MPTTRTWKCKCGDFHIQLANEPVISWICHCHSCVAASRFIDEKHGGKGTSALTEGGGSNMTLYRIADIKFLSENSSDKLGYVKIGDKSGRGMIWPVRSYAKCCGTQVMTTGNSIPAYCRHLNANCLYDEDGSKYKPEHPPQNLNAKASFDPSAVPDPKHDSAPPSIFPRLFPSMMRALFGIRGDHAKERAFFIDAADEEVESVPITWE